MIELKNISKAYGKINALENINLHIRQQSITGIIGKNGSGKSTLIKVITGLITDFSGQMILQSDHIKIGLASEGFDLPDYYAVRRILEIFKIQKGCSDADLKYWCERLELSKYLNSKISNLSHGNKQRLNILISIIGNNELIILDEPNNGLDPHGFILLRDIIRELKSGGTTVIIASHILNELENVCDEIVFLHLGKKLLETSTINVLNKYGSIESAFIDMLQ